MTGKGEREGGQLLKRAEASCGGEAGPEALERSAKRLAHPAACRSDHPVPVTSLRLSDPVGPSW